MPTTPDTLYILWTNADPITSEKMVFMYATNSMLHGWWRNVTVIIWGATAKLAAENGVIQERIRLAQQAGVFFSACIACAEQLGVADKLKELGVEVKGWGAGLTDLLKDGERLLTV
jgi:hypothetical protein